MSREITSIAIEAEESETARGGFRPSSSGRQRSLQGSFEEGPSGGLSPLAEAAGTFAPLRGTHLEPVYPTGRLRPSPFTELSYTLRANSASYLIPVSFLAAEPSWTTARHNAFCYL